VKKIKSSLQRITKLEGARQSAGIPALRPLLDVPTRWSSTYLMLKRAIDIRKVGEILFEELK
jgi:hypothetical protein